MVKKREPTNKSLGSESSVEGRPMAAKGRSMKRAILTTALLLALPVGVAAQSAPDLEVAFAEVDDSTPVEGGRFKLWVTVGNFGLSNRFSVISSRACREELLHLFFPAGQVQVLPAG